MTPNIDIGHGVTIHKIGWKPDRELNPQYDGIPDIEWAGIIIDHPFGPGPTNERYRGLYNTNRELGRCSGYVSFDGETMRRISPNSQMWTVESFDPLTISPSVLCCACGHHGFIRQGLWVPA